MKQTKMGKDSRRVSNICTVCGAGLGVVSCVSMILATVAAFGVSLGAGLSQASIPFSRPLLVFSLLLMVFGVTIKGVAPGILTVVGGMLVYLGMFELPGQSTDMMGMESTPSPSLPLATFWLGVIFIIGAYVFAYWPRRPKQR